MFYRFCVISSFFSFVLSCCPLFYFWSLQVSILFLNEWCIIQLKAEIYRTHIQDERTLVGFLMHHNKQMLACFYHLQILCVRERQLLSEYSVLCACSYKVVQENKIFQIMKIFTSESMSYISSQISSLKYLLIYLKII